MQTLGGTPGVKGLVQEEGDNHKDFQHNQHGVQANQKMAFAVEVRVVGRGRSSETTSSTVAHPLLMADIRKSWATIGVFHKGRAGIAPSSTPVYMPTPIARGAPTAATTRRAVVHLRAVKRLPGR